MQTETFFYPIGLNLEDIKCLVIGGGNVATRKVLKLIEYKAKSITVISLDLTSILDECHKQNQIKWINREYKKTDIRGEKIIFAATDNDELNCEIGKSAKKNHLLVNVVSSPEHGNFILPAIYRKKHLCIATFTDGYSPKFAQFIRDEIANHLQENITIQLQDGKSKNN